MNKKIRNYLIVGLFAFLFVAIGTSGLMFAIEEPLDDDTPGGEVGDDGETEPTTSVTETKPTPTTTTIPTTTPITTTPTTSTIPTTDTTTTTTSNTNTETPPPIIEEQDTYFLIFLAGGFTVVLYIWRKK